MEEQRTIDDKWGEETTSYGWVAVPSLLLFYQKSLEITSVEMNVLMNLLLHWWDKEKKPYPAQGSIARRMGVSTRTVQRALDSLLDKQLIGRSRSSVYNPVYKGRNLYDLQPLVIALDKISKSEPLLKKIEKKD